MQLSSVFPVYFQSSFTKGGPPLLSFRPRKTFRFAISPALTRLVFRIQIGEVDEGYAGPLPFFLFLFFFEKPRDTFANSNGSERGMENARIALQSHEQFYNKK